MRFARPASLLRVTSSFRDLGLTLVSPGGTPTYPEIPQGDGVTLVTADLPIPAGSGDIFVTFHGSTPYQYGACPTSSVAPWLASVEALP
jgi:hypothetical protein